MTPEYSELTFTQRHVYHLLLHKRGRVHEAEFLSWTKDLLRRVYALAGNMSSEDLQANLRANWFPVISVLEENLECDSQKHGQIPAEDEPIGVAAKF